MYVTKQVSPLMAMCTDTLYRTLNQYLNENAFSFSFKLFVGRDEPAVSFNTANKNLKYTQFLIPNNGFDSSADELSFNDIFEFTF